MRSWKVTVAVLLTSVMFLGSGTPLLAQAAKKSSEKKSEETDKKSEEKKTKKKTKEAPSKSESYDLQVQGKFGGPAKGSGDFYDFSFTSTEGKKKSNKKVWLKIDSGTTLLCDKAVGVAEFKEGESLMIFGKPMDFESGGKGYSSGKEFRIQAARIIIGGKAVTVNDDYKDAKDKGFQWCEGSVEKAGQAITVQYQGASNRVSIDKGAAILKRGDGDLKKDLRKGALILVKASKISEEPEGEKEKREAYRAGEVLIIAQASLGWYDALFPKE